eukprot:SAG31_NODE_513_length_14715_cov_22.844554_4_plen_65_part_00
MSVHDGRGLRGLVEEDESGNLICYLQSWESFGTQLAIQSQVCNADASVRSPWQMLHKECISSID